MKRWAIPCSCVAVISMQTPGFGVDSPPPDPPQNVLLLIGDDLGVERIGAYGEHPDPGHTPNLDRLATHGVLFRNAWSTPYCSATRSTILTGRLPFRTGVGAFHEPESQFALSASEITLPELIDEGTDGAYHCAALGKWHLAGLPVGAPTHPLACRFDLHAGSLHNLEDYFVWSKNFNGQIQTVAKYATSDTTDDAIRAVALLPEPWFVWVAYNATHTPLHAPPSHLHTYNLSGNPDDTPVEHSKAMIEAMDKEIGRLLSSMAPEVRARTTIIFVGDNGTYWPTSDGPFDPSHAKGSCYEGGVNVPLIVDGPRVASPGSECTAMVHTADLYATIANLAGVDVEACLPSGHAIDSVSLLPYLHDPARPSIRHVLYTEIYAPNGLGPKWWWKRAVRDERYKLIRKDTTAPFGEPPEVVELLFDLEADPLETTNLLEGTMSPRLREEYLRLRGKLLNP